MGDSTSPSFVSVETVDAKRMAHVNPSGIEAQTRAEFGNPVCSIRVTLLLTVDGNICDLSNVYTGVIHGR
jgi:hypothetical protein